MGAVESYSHRGHHSGLLKRKGTRVSGTGDVFNAFAFINRAHVDDERAMRCARCDCAAVWCGVLRCDVITVRCDAITVRCDAITVRYGVWCGYCGVVWCGVVCVGVVWCGGGVSSAPLYSPRHSVCLAACPWAF